MWVYSDSKIRRWYGGGIGFSKSRAKGGGTTRSKSREGCDERLTYGGCPQRYIKMNEFEFVRMPLLMEGRPYGFENFEWSLHEFCYSLSIQAPGRGIKGEGKYDCREGIPTTGSTFHRIHEPLLHKNFSVCIFTLIQYLARHQDNPKRSVTQLDVAQVSLITASSFMSEKSSTPGEFYFSNQVTPFRCNLSRCRIGDELCDLSYRDRLTLVAQGEPGGS